ncbi:hypothetical protein SprV_0100169400 [Sparganum proliferum]
MQTGPSSLALESRKLAIALICDCFYPNAGGVENHIYQLAQCLLLRGHRVIIVTHAYGGGWQRQGVRYMARGLKVYYIPYRPFYNQSVFITLFGLLPVIRDILVRENIDVVHGHSAFSPLALESLMHSSALGLRTVFTDHSLFGFADLSSVLANKALFLLLNTVDNFICVSNVAKENTVLRGGMSPDRVFVIPNAIDSSAFTPEPSARDPENITVVVISRLVYRKGADLLGAIIPPLCATFTNLKFIIGGDGPKRLVLEEMIERHNLHSRVQLLGTLLHHKVRDVLVKGDIFLNTSLTESFCIAIVEAASCGLLVVSTAVGGVPEVLPPHMLRLAPVSASGLASTLADTIEEVRQQRIIWTQASPPPCDSFSSLDELCPVPQLREPVDGDKSRISTSANSLAEPETNDALTRQTAANDLRRQHTGESVPTSAWPPVLASRQIWQMHREVGELYTWPNVAERTEKVYFTAMTQPRGSTRTGMLAALCRLGPVEGKIMAIVWALEWLLLIILEWLRPSKNIDRVPFLYAASGPQGGA